MGQDSSVGLETRYGLDGLGIESQWDRDFPHPSRPVLELTQPPIQSVPSPFRVGKAAGAWCKPQPRLALRLKKEQNYTSLLGLHGLF
jgi:hypothetical protein